MYMYPNVHSSAVYKIAKTRKQSKCPWTEKWIKKMQYIYTMEYYAAIQKKKRRPSAVTQMDLQIVILSEVNQTDKEKYCMASLLCGI